MRVVFEVVGQKQAEVSLMGMAARAEEPVAVLEALDEDFRKLATQQFDSQGAFRSGGWAPLAQATLDAKAAEGLDPRILHATLRLRDSVTGTTDHISRVEGQELQFGTQVPYATFHQTGTSRMPRRPVMELNDDDVHRWVKVLQRWLVEGRSRAW